MFKKDKKRLTKFGRFCFYVSEKELQNHNKMQALFKFIIHGINCEAIVVEQEPGSKGVTFLLGNEDRLKKFITCNRKAITSNLGELFIENIHSQFAICSRSNNAKSIVLQTKNKPRLVIGELWDINKVIHNVSFFSEAVKESCTKTMEILYNMGARIKGVSLAQAVFFTCGYAHKSEFDIYMDLHTAICYGDIATVDLLIKLGVFFMKNSESCGFKVSDDFYLADLIGQAIKAKISKKIDRVELIRVLLNNKDKNGKCVILSQKQLHDLFLLIYKSECKLSSEQIKAYIKILCDFFHDGINTINKDGNSLLYTAIQKGNFDIMKILIELKIDVQLKHPKDGWSFAHVAAFYNRADMLYFLHKVGVPVNEPNHERMTPYQVAAVCKKKAAKEALLAILKGAEDGYAAARVLYYTHGGDKLNDAVKFYMPTFTSGTVDEALYYIQKSFFDFIKKIKIDSHSRIKKLGAIIQGIALDAKTSVRALIRKVKQGEVVFVRTGFCNHNVLVRLELNAEKLCSAVFIERGFFLGCNGSTNYYLRAEAKSTIQVDGEHLRWFIEQLRLVQVAEKEVAARILFKEIPKKLGTSYKFNKKFIKKPFKENICFYSNTKTAIEDFIVSFLGPLLGEYIAGKFKLFLRTRSLRKYKCVAKRNDYNTKYNAMYNAAKAACTAKMMKFNNVVVKKYDVCALTLMKGGSKSELQACLMFWYLRDKTKEFTRAARAFNSFGVNFFKEGKYKHAIAIFSELKVFWKLFGDVEQVAICNHNIGSAHLKCGKYQSAYIHLFKAMKFREGLPENDKRRVGTEKKLRECRDHVPPQFCSKW